MGPPSERNTETATAGRAINGEKVVNYQKTKKAALESPRHAKKSTDACQRVARSPGSAKVFKLPAGRGQLSANIACATAGASKLLAVLHSEFLAGLRPVPGRIAMAAEAWRQCEENSAHARKWANVIDIYIALLSDSRERIMSAAASEMATGLGLRAAEAIAAVEDAAVPVREHVKSGLPLTKASDDAARALSSAACLLAETLAAIFQLSASRSNPDGDIPSGEGETQPVFHRFQHHRK